MSEHHTSTSHDAHADAGPGALKKISIVIALLVVPVAIVVGLVNQYKAGDGSGSASLMTEEAIAGRIQKVGMLSMGESKRELKTGEEVFKAQCTTCHTAGVVGAPKFGDAALWAPRIKTGYEALLNSALKGKGNMTPQGGGAFSDLEIARAVVYMANAAGASFAEPPAPADAAPASADAAASAAKQ